MRIACTLASLALATSAISALADDRPLSTIGLASCIKQDRPAPALVEAAAVRPDAFIFLGDNIYGDSTDADVISKKYAALAALPGMIDLRTHAAAGTTRIFATWDDHDMGANDKGRDFSARKQNQALFCDFWQDPADAPRRTRDGVYDSTIIGPEGKRVQIILLDTRSFRAPLLSRPRPDRDAPKEQRDAWTAGDQQRRAAGYPGTYLPITEVKGDNADVLGEAQWAWLREQLLKPAEVRIICTSIQFVSEENRFENWANFPAERVRMVRLLNETKADGVLFVSGDRHWSELSRLDPGDLTAVPPTFEDRTIKPAAEQPRYPLWDITSSAINQPRSRGSFENNAHRVGEPLMTPSFGLLTIDWSAAPVTITAEFRNEQGSRVTAQRINLDTLRGK